MNAWKLRSPVAGVRRRNKQIKTEWEAALAEAAKQHTHVVHLPADHSVFTAFRPPRQRVRRYGTRSSHLRDQASSARSFTAWP